MGASTVIDAAAATRWRIRAFLGLICVLLLAGLWSFAWIADRRERDNHIDDLAARVRTAANAYATSLAAQFHTIDQMLLYAAADYERDPQRFDLKFWLAQIPSLRAMAADFSLLDSRGIVLQSSAGRSAVGLDLSDRASFAAHRGPDNGELYIGNVVRERTTRRKAMQISRRVVDRRGNFAGVLIFSVDPEMVMGTLDRLRVGLEGGGTLLREGGAPIVRVVGLKRETDFSPTRFESDGYASADAAFLGDYYDARVVRAARAIDNYHLVVSAEGDVAEALAEITTRRNVIWVGAGALTVAIVALFLFLAFDLGRLKRLRRALECSNRELLKAKQDAEAAVEAKSRFLANISHELRTPLNAIIGFADLLKSKLYGPLNERQADYVGYVQSSGQHLLALINDVLDVSRLDLDGYELNFRELDVAAEIRGCLGTVSVAANGKDIGLDLEVAPSLPAVLADERAVRQVLLNLLSNAVKFTPAGGTVAVAAGRRKDGALEIAVSDSGIGIAKDDIARLFHPFQRAEHTRPVKTEGTGLGLVISRRLMEKHGGTLVLESEPGKGTRAVAVFPARSLVAPAPPVPPAAPAPRLGERPRGAMAM
jgi:signal transduction histidine kinase